MVEVLVTDEFTEWYGLLDDNDAMAVGRYIGLLETQGVSLR